MKKNIRIICFLFATLLFSPVIGQVKKDSLAADALSFLSPEHRLIPGTRVYLVPPTGYKPSLIYPGLIHPDGGRIRIFETRINPDKSKNRISLNDQIKLEGGRAIDQFELNLHGYPARYSLWQKSQGRMCITISIADSSFLIEGEAEFAAYDDEILAAHKNGMLSLVYDRNRFVAPFEETFFTLDYSANSLLPSHDPGTGYIFCLEGREEPMPGEPFARLNILITDQNTTALSIAERMLKEDQTEYAASSQIRKVSTRLIDGNDVFEREVFLQTGGGKILLYQGIVLFPGRTIVLQGYAWSQFGECLEMFKNLLSGIHLKSEILKP